MKTDKITSRLYELIKGLLSDNLSKKEQVELSHTPEMEEQMMGQWDREGRDVLKDEIGHHIWKQVRKSCFDQVKPKKNRTIYWRVAASVAIVMLMGGALMYWFDNWETKEKFIEITSADGHLYLLPDSSKVWMYPGSTIRFSENFSSNRKVWLTGSSLFEVKKQQGKHFMVYMNGDNYVEVKGTSFLIRQDGSNISKVSLFSGVVEFNIERTKRKIEMHPSQELIFDSFTDEAEMNELVNVEWKDGNYEFNNIDLRSWTLLMEQIFDVKIRLDMNGEMKNLLTGRIRYNETLEESIGKLCFSVGVNYRQEKNEYVIFR